MPHCDLSMRLGLLQNNLIKKSLSVFLFLENSGAQIIFRSVCQIMLRCPEIPSHPASPFPTPLRAHVLRGCIRVSSRSLQVGRKLWGPSSQSQQGPALCYCHHSSPAPGDLPILQSSLENEKISVNCKALTNTHLLALARPQASLIPLEENPSLP